MSVSQRLKERREALQSAKTSKKTLKEESSSEEEVSTKTKKVLTKIIKTTKEVPTKKPKETKEVPTKETKEVPTKTSSKKKLTKTSKKDESEESSSSEEEKKITPKESSRKSPKVILEKKSSKEKTSSKEKASPKEKTSSKEEKASKEKAPFKEKASLKEEKSPKEKASLKEEKSPKEKTSSKEEKASKEKTSSKEEKSPKEKAPLKERNPPSEDIRREITVSPRGKVVKSEKPQSKILEEFTFDSTVARASSPPRTQYIGGNREKEIRQIGKQKKNRKKNQEDEGKEWTILSEEERYRRIGLYFGDRNDISWRHADLREGLNYTVETLKYMTVYGKSDVITKLMLQYIPYNPIIIFECCAGIGGNTLSFLDNVNVNHVFSFERDPDRLKMLKRNVEAYKLGDRLTTGGEFEGVPQNYPGPILYFDPPWLPPEIPGQESNPTQYLRSDVYIGDKSLEEWILTQPYVALTAIRVPPEYTDANGKRYPGYSLDLEKYWKKLPSEPGKKKVSLENWEIIYDDKNVAKSRLIFVRSAIGMQLGQEKSIKVKPRPEWVEDLRNFLRSHLSIFIKDRDIVERFLTDTNMPLWIQGFTYRSVDLEYNYEELETLGDGLLKAEFIIYLRKRYPKMKKQGLTVMGDRYSSTEYMAFLSRKLGYHRYVRTQYGRTTRDIEEDLVESVIGVLYEIGQRIQLGFGYQAVANYVNAVFTKYVEFKEEYMFGREKSRLKEMFEGLGWGNHPDLVIRRDDEDSGYVVELYLTEDAYEYLLLKKPNVPLRKLIAEGYGSTQSVAEVDAYTQGVAYLDSIGVTYAWVEQEKKTYFFEKPTIKPYISAFKKNMKARGFVDYRFENLKEESRKDFSIVLLIGIKADRSEHMISPATGKNKHAAMAKLVEIIASD